MTIDGLAIQAQYSHITSPDSHPSSFLSFALCSLHGCRITTTTTTTRKKTDEQEEEEKEEQEQDKEARTTTYDVTQTQVVEVDAARQESPIGTQARVSDSPFSHDSLVASTRSELARLRLRPTLLCAVKAQCCMSSPQRSNVIPNERLAPL